MKIAIIGHGKMGRMIEEIALSRGHKIVAVIDENNQSDFESDNFIAADVAIEFSRPDAAVNNILHCFAAKVPVVSGTTGWTDSLPELKSLAERGDGALLWSSNFSIGMNIFMATSRYLTSLMKNYPQYSPRMEEVHHIHKLDHPSGTAITLAEDLIEILPGIKGWYEPENDESVKAGTLPIRAHREGEVPGIHSIIWESDADEITITHSAKSRRGFALGAVLAAEWLAKNGRQGGFFTMKNVLGF